MDFDDLVIVGESFQEVEKMNSDSIELFEKEGFELHKWHSTNQPDLETNNLNSQKEFKKNIAEKNILEEKRMKLKYQT